MKREKIKIVFKDDFFWIPLFPFMYFILNGFGKIFLSIPEIERVKTLFQTVKKNLFFLN